MRDTMTFGKGQAAFESVSATANPLRGQAALDFLMTYGWAIVIIVIVASVLFAIGVFDVSNFVGTKAAGFSGVAVQGWSFNNNGTLAIKLTNQVGKRINITGVNVTVSGEAQNFTSLPALVDAGATTGQLNSSQFTGAGKMGIGAGYQAKLVINYTDMNSGFAVSTKGTLTGKAV